MNNINNIKQEYFKILNQQKFVEKELDYTIFEKQIPFLTQMAQVNNSGLTVFDLHKKEHIFNSFNLDNLFGYNLDKIDTNYYNSRIHPDDVAWLMKVGTSAIKYSYAIPISERKKKNYKLVNEYRILNSQNKYIRIIEQFQILELDKSGNFWLALSTMDISPNQEDYDGIRSQWINLDTGESRIIATQDQNYHSNLSKRELEIFSFVKKGLLSKEISERLSISLHTVNTHRQNILKKLGANSSIEAIEYAKKLNLV